MRKRLTISMTSLALVIFISVGAGTTATTATTTTKAQAAAGGDIWPMLDQNPQRTAQDCFEVGVGSTAVVQDGIISVGGGDPMYFALEAASGRIEWKHSLGSPDAGYFAWASPLIYTPPGGPATQRWTAVGV